LDLRTISEWRMAAHLGASNTYNLLAGFVKAER
jgi:hypothetical protein